MSTRRVSIGGVPEHFNLPWRLAIEEGAFAELGVEVEWLDFPGGTGDLMRALASADIDMATPLTEGAVAAIAAGNPSRILATWVESPLLWGVHVAAHSDARTIEDVVGRRFAISRSGSGSELMSRLLAADQGWSLTDDSFVVVGDLAGALRALPAGDADVFLWNKSMTQPHVDSGTFRRIATVTTPWPCFVVAANETFLAENGELAGNITTIATARAQSLAGDDHRADIVANRYGLAAIDAESWFGQVRWAESDGGVEPAMIEGVVARLQQIGRIDDPVPADLIIAM